MRVSVFAPPANSHRISTLSPVLNFALISADLFDGRLQVRPATVIDAADSAETAPRAALCSGCVCVGLHEPRPSSTAEPPFVPPPIFEPAAKPEAGSNVADRLPRIFAPGSCARAVASPAIAPLSYTVEKAPTVSRPLTSMRKAPWTVPTLSVVLMTLRTRSVIAPARSVSPAAVPVYFPSVTVIALPSVVVHVRDGVVPADAENVAATAFAVFAPSIPCATATLVVASAARPAIVRTTLRISLPPIAWSAQRLVAGHVAPTKL